MRRARGRWSRFRSRRSGPACPPRAPRATPPTGRLGSLCRRARRASGRVPVWRGGRDGSLRARPCRFSTVPSLGCVICPFPVTVARGPGRVNRSIVSSARPAAAEAGRRGSSSGRGGPSRRLRGRVCLTPLPEPLLVTCVPSSGPCLRLRGPCPRVCDFAWRLLVTARRAPPPPRRARVTASSWTTASTFSKSSRVPRPWGLGRKHIFSGGKNSTRNVGMFRVFISS